MDNRKSELFTLQIETGNAAFDESPASELARILRKAADRIEAGQSEGYLFDHNGNRCGTYSIKPDRRRAR